MVPKYQAMRVPRVSVIIPCYNTAQYVAETMRSVFAQTYKDFEVVVVNDGSPDTPDLEKVLAPWMEKIVYVKTTNQGLAGARNNGIRASQGELIALLDSDDFWEPNYLEVQVGKLDADPTADIVYPNAVGFRDGNTTETPIFVQDFLPSKGEVTFTSIVRGTVNVMVSLLARRESFERVGLFDSQLRSCEDLDMWLRCVKSGSRIIYHDVPLMHYRIRRGSLSSDSGWMFDHRIKVLTKMRTAVPLTAEERQALEHSILHSQSQKFYSEAKRAFEAQEYALALEKLKQAYACTPSFRLRCMLVLLKASPRLARVFYDWRLRSLPTEIKAQKLYKAKKAAVQV